MNWLLPLASGNCVGSGMDAEVARVTLKLDRLLEVDTVKSISPVVSLRVLPWSAELEVVRRSAEFGVVPWSAELVAARRSAQFGVVPRAAELEAARRLRIERGDLGHRAA